MTRWVWLDERDALVIHDRSLVAHGGGLGLRDRGLLQSAIARPQNLLFYGEARDAIDLAAAYTGGIVQNHPFVDGNKRTGFLLGILFLELNGWTFIASEEDAAEAVLKLAAGEMDEKGYGLFLRKQVRRA